jgi:DNA-binding NtrC family response regulator
MVTQMTNRGCVVLLGDFSNERLDVGSIVRDFSWSVVHASNLSELKEIGRTRTVLAVLLQAAEPDLAWQGALRAIKAAAPRARIIVCHKVDQAHERAEMVDAGAFGVLLSPLAHSEVRQSLGFVWASKIAPIKPSPALKAQHVSAA